MEQLRLETIRFEGQDTKWRVDGIVPLGQKIFQDGVTSNSILKLFKEATPLIHPNVLPSYWEHIFASAAIAQAMDPKLKTTVLLHDIGRLAIPHRYYRTDLIGHLMLRKIGVPEEIITHIPNMKDFLEGTATFEKLTPEQRIVNLSDNLGKRTSDGTLFTVETFLEYLAKQKNRYPENHPFSSEKYGVSHEREASKLQAQIVIQTIQWLKSLGVDFYAIRESIKNVAPKIIYLVRHGNLHNPQDLVYNWEPPIGLSNEGRQQIKDVAQMIKERRVSFPYIYTSDLPRARESADIIAAVFETPEVLQRKELRDTFAPALVGRPMTELKEKYGGNVYTDDFIKKHHHETVEQVTNRMFTEIELTQQPSANGSVHVCLVGHGDPLRFLREKLEFPDIELTVDDYPRLSNEKYLEKGQAWEIILDPNGDFIKAQIVNPEIE